MTEKVREALMRLTMCAREECAICKYKEKCGFDFQFETATDAMHIILEALRERPKGEWKSLPWKRDLEIDIRLLSPYKCDTCDKEIRVERIDGYNYCPNCGTEMENG